MYLIVSYTPPRTYRYWTGHRWAARKSDAVRYLVRSRAFSAALGCAVNSHHDGSVGLIPVGGG